MRTLTLNIELENDAFAEAPNVEAARILRELATLIADSGDTLTFEPCTLCHLRDINGNKVGTAQVVEL